jgi:hypothetical protein
MMLLLVKVLLNIFRNLIRHRLLNGQMIYNAIVGRFRETYSGAPFLTDYLFDVELVSKIIMNLKGGKAAGLDNLSAEHVFHSHPILSVALTKLFNVMLLTAYVPDAFGHSYTVPIPKNDCCTKPKTCLGLSWHTDQSSCSRSSLEAIVCNIITVTNSEN